MGQQKQDEATRSGPARRSLPGAPRARPSLRHGPRETLPSERSAHLRVGGPPQPHRCLLPWALLTPRELRPGRGSSRTCQPACLQPKLGHMGHRYGGSAPPPATPTPCLLLLRAWHTHPYTAVYLGPTMRRAWLQTRGGRGPHAQRSPSRPPGLGCELQGDGGGGAALRPHRRALLAVCLWPEMCAL